MPKTRHISGIIAVLILLMIASEQSLKAYVDPGSGAMYVQIILAAVIGFLIKIRGRLAGLFRSKTKPSDGLYDRNRSVSRQS